MTTPVVIAGTNYTAESVETTFDTDAVIQARIIGLHSIAHGAAFAFQGSHYQVADVSWNATTDRTTVRGLRSVDANAVIQHLLTTLLAQLDFWSNEDAFFKRLVGLAGGTIAYARLIQQDIGDSVELGALTRAFRNNLLDIDYIPDGTAGAPAGVVPIWRAAWLRPFIVRPVGAPEYRRTGSLASAVSGAALASAELQDAKAAAESVVTALNAYIDEVITVADNITAKVQAPSFTAAVDALPDTIDAAVRARAWTTAELAALNVLETALRGIIIDNDYLAVQIADPIFLGIVEALQALLPQYNAALGTGYANAVTAIVPLREMVLVVWNVVFLAPIYLRQVLDLQRRKFLSNIYNQFALIGTHAAVQALAARIAKSRLSDLTKSVTAVTVPAEVAPWGACYLDDDELTVRVFPTGVDGRAGVQWVPGVQPDRYHAVLRVLQADTLSRMNAGRVSLEVSGGTLPQYSQIIADLGLPNGATHYRAEGVRTRRSGPLIETTIDAAAIPDGIHTTPVATVNEYRMVTIRPRTIVAEPTGYAVNQPLSGVADTVTLDLTSRAYAEMGMQRIVARQAALPANGGDDLSLDSRAYGSEDFIYVYSADAAAPNAATAVRRSTGRRDSIAAAADALYPGVYTTRILYNARVAGYALQITPGTPGALLLVACLGYAQTSSPLESYDVPILSFCQLDADFNFGAWTTRIARPTGPAGETYLSRSWTDRRSRDGAFRPAIYHGGLYYEILSRTYYGGGQNWYCSPSATPYINDAQLGTLAGDGLSGGTDFLDPRWGVNPSARSPDARGNRIPPWPTARVELATGAQRAARNSRYLSLTPAGNLMYRPSTAARLLDLGNTNIRNATCIQIVADGEYLVVDAETSVWRLRFDPAAVTAPITSR